MKYSKELLRSLPKVLLHDHLDGGVRPQTVIELANEVGYRKLPTTDPAGWPNGFTEVRRVEACPCSWKVSNTPAV